MSFTNQEKQERYRKKEYLKKRADEIFRDWQLLGWSDFNKNPKDVYDINNGLWSGRDKLLWINKYEK